MRSKKASYIMYYIDVEHKYTTKNSYMVEVHSANPGSIHHNNSPELIVI